MKLGGFVVFLIQTGIYVVSVAYIFWSGQKSSKRWCDRYYELGKKHGYERGYLEGKRDQLIMFREELRDFQNSQLKKRIN